MLDGIDRFWGTVPPDDPYVASVIEQAQRAGILVFAIYTPGEGHYGHSYWRITGASFIFPRLPPRLEANRITSVFMAPRFHSSPTWIL